MVNRHSGFSLIEVLVALALFMLVLLLLFRGVTAVTTTVTAGERQNRLQRETVGVERVMRADLEDLLVHADWPVYLGDAAAEAPVLVLAFLKYRTLPEAENCTEWVQYWTEAHPDEARLRQWVRYAGPADNRSELKGNWWERVTRDQLTGEVLAEHLISLEVGLWTPEGKAAGNVILTNRIDMVDIKLFLTDPPFPVVQTPSANALQRMWQENGTWTHFRTRPVAEPGPDWERGP